MVDLHKEEENELRKLGICLNGFTRDMWDRLCEKEKEGFCGWDSSQQTCCEELEMRLMRSLSKYFRAEFIPEAKEALADIANFAMFLWDKQR